MKAVGFESLSRYFDVKVGMKSKWTLFTLLSHIASLDVNKLKKKSLGNL